LQSRKLFEVRTHGQIGGPDVFNRKLEELRQTFDFIPRQRRSSVLDIGNELHRASACTREIRQSQLTLQAILANQIAERSVGLRTFVDATLPFRAPSQLGSFLHDAPRLTSKQFFAKDLEPGYSKRTNGKEHLSDLARCMRVKLWGTRGSLPSPPTPAEREVRVREI